MTEKSQNKIGYARVSTTDQKFQAQIDVLKKHGCGIIYSEKIKIIKFVSEAALLMAALTTLYMIIYVIH